VTVVIIDEKLLEREPFPYTPTIMQYRIVDAEDSMPNTPATFSWYVMSLVFQWVKEQGGVKAMEERIKKRSQKLYEYIDHTGFYLNRVEKRYRSRVNVVFSLQDEKLSSQFLEEAGKIGLVNLKGHRLAGGMRASLYNGMPDSGIEALIDFMKEFENRYG
jgi:phosphoserine aminotransferase